LRYRFREIESWLSKGEEIEIYKREKLSHAYHLLTQNQWITPILLPSDTAFSEEEKRAQPELDWFLQPAEPTELPG
jgi:hypothetical protein